MTQPIPEPIPPSQAQQARNPIHMQGVVKLSEADDVEYLREVAKTLWDLLDNIDTADDMFKDRHIAYRTFVRMQQNRRWNTRIFSDGYDLFLKPTDT